MLATRSIRQTLIRMMLFTSSLALLSTCAAFFVYEMVMFRRTAMRELSTLSAIIATNSTAALAFDNQNDARGVLSALRAEPHIVAACLYTADGMLFASHPQSVVCDQSSPLPTAPWPLMLITDFSFLTISRSVIEDAVPLGSLFLQSDIGALVDRARLYSTVAMAVLLGSLLVSYVAAWRVQHRISQPILALTTLTSTIIQHQDYSLRAHKSADDEIGMLADTFNIMLGQLQEQLSRLALLNQITRSITERLDAKSIFQVVLHTLKDNFHIDFGCFGFTDPTSPSLRIECATAASDVVMKALQPQLFLTLSETHLVYVPDSEVSPLPFLCSLAARGLRSVIVAPLVVEDQPTGALLVARSQPNGFSGPECDFLRQLSEHVSIASHQSHLYTALQRAYDDLRHTQHTVLQQERLRALGQMASGLAHDINNAISPITLYTEILLEREQGLSPQGRESLYTIQRAIADVAQTVTRMREFYRQRDPRLGLTSVSLNTLVTQVLDLTQARWRTMPQEKGFVITVHTVLSPVQPEIRGIEGEIRDALTNLIFNAVDAMPEGGILTIHTQIDGNKAIIEVSDTGVGMDEATRARCLEPFFTTKGAQGTGLGLSMVYGMAQRHGADLTITSAVGQGTTVGIVFPALQKMEEVAPAPVLTQTVKGLRLLLIDDDPMVLTSLRDALSGDEHTVVTADGGQQGITVFRQAIEAGAPFAVVITDLGMPYVDGRKVAASIKELSPATPVILLTGWGKQLTVENEPTPHIDRLLSKPPMLRDLRAALAEVTDNKTRHA